MNYRTLEIDHGGGMLATIWLNRPGHGNALDAVMLEELAAAFAGLANLAQLRAVVLAARGPQFCVGSALDWRGELAASPPAWRRADADLAGLLQTMQALPAPVVARVQGDCQGAGAGLVAACDIALAAGHAGFCLPEAQADAALTAYIPWLEQAAGARAARRYLLTAERLSAFEAKQIGLVHEAVAADALHERTDAIVAALLQANNKKVFGERIWNTADKMDKATGSPAA
ncbi:enoyl-CoA hydratase-related protein [Janthinobacterium sp. 17J80-10]|uniref:enoyl-CoA hydratase-related protein n=1 Tax=Janthinobacterium sp. 17J80-10 TaxID=2497863 RepID=UPI0013E8EF32|nr:enoyl-CoA hydratase-related protein [Janthinobacterium sp. 17J80-10]